MRNETWVNRCTRKLLVPLDPNTEFGIMMWTLERKSAKHRFIESNWIWKGSRVLLFSMKKARAFMMTRGTPIARCIASTVSMIITGVEGTFTTPRVRYKDFNDSIGSAILIFTYGLMSPEATRVEIYICPQYPIFVNWCSVSLLFKWWSCYTVIYNKDSRYTRKIIRKWTKTEDYFITWPVDQHCLTPCFFSFFFWGGGNFYLLIHHSVRRYR